LPFTPEDSRSGKSHDPICRAISRALSLFWDPALINRFSPDGLRDQEVLEQCLEDRQSVRLGECQQRARVGHDDHRPSISDTNFRQLASRSSGLALIGLSPLLPSKARKSR